MMRCAIALMLLLYMASSAMASPSCMTQHEARKHYPTSWLYWHTEHHCWDNHRGRRIVITRTVPIPMPRPLVLPTARTEFDLRFWGQ